MLGRLLILFLVVPLVELYLLLRFADALGIPTTIAVVILTGICGSMLAARQGSQAIRNFQSAIAQGRVPGGEAIDGILIAFAAAMLLTPGLLTDTCGIILLNPWTRVRFRQWLVSRYAKRFQVVTFTQGRPSGGNSGGFDGAIFDGDDEDTLDASFRPTRKPPNETPLIDRH